MGFHIQNLFSSFTSASSWFELYAAFAAFLMLLRTAFNELIPERFRPYIVSKLNSCFSKYQANSEICLKINQFWDKNMGGHNELFYAAQEYLPTRISHAYKSLKIGKLPDENHIELAVDGSEAVVDEFDGTKFTWKLEEVAATENPNFKKKCSFELTFNEKDRKKAFDLYIPHVLKTYEAIQAERRIVRIYSWIDSHWNVSDLSHPATFDSLALSPELRKDIIEDLERFLRRKKHYKKVGKPWKRGYLLYGPPGTGKSSLIAAMANYLKFNVYDLELASIRCNSDLMRSMKEASNRSIIVIEDIDCNEEVQARSVGLSDDQDSGSATKPTKKASKVKAKSEFTLSGLLNYMDGLWSSGGEERIIIFTTNHKEKIDPALLRPGRMDKHIHLSFLRGKAFRVLASNYLDIEGDHPLFEEIEGLLEKLQVTPAVVAEQLMRNEDPDDALESLVTFLKEMDKDSNCDIKS